MSPLRLKRDRLLSVSLIPILVAALLLSVIVPALEMRRVTRLLTEISDIVGPSRQVVYRIEQVAAHERQSLFINAGLVIFSLAAIAAVVSISVRERRLAAILQRRVEEESAMARMARTLSEAVTIEDAIDRILEGTTTTIPMVGAYLEVVDGESHRSAAFLGAGPAMHLGVYDRLPIPITEDLKTRNEPGVPYEIHGVEWRLPPDLMPDCLHCTGLVVPLVLGDKPFGVLLVLRDARTGSFAENERCQMRLIGDLATAVIRRVDVERKAMVEMQQRAMSETALREAAEALAAAFTMDDVTQQIARSALDATQARGSFVETIETAANGSIGLVVRGTAGVNVPSAGSKRAYAGSFTERVVGQESPVVASDIATAYPSTSKAASSEPPVPTIALPITDSSGPIGALYVVGAASGKFGADDTGWAHTIAHLATLAYEKIRLLDEARDGRDELERVMKSRERLMRGFSHDVKNPLGAADGYADLLSAGIYGQLEPRQTESLQRIRRSIRRALDLIDDLHELARAETGSISIRKELIDVGELVKASGDEYRGAAHSAGLPLTVDVADGVPLVETDSARVRQIVGNLLSNAIKYTKTGAVTVRVRKYPAVVVRKGRLAVDIEVTDTGLGIPPDKHEQIFEEFSRLDTSDRPGAGLGLAISKRVAEALGGQIMVSSEVGCGSTFTLRIPAGVRESSNQVQSVHCPDSVPEATLTVPQAAGR